ncbi:putative ribonuclease H-like domain-containing protein [Tanacetum coccineum]
MTLKHGVLYKPAASRFKNHESSNLKTKTSANSDIQDLPSRYQDYQDKDCQGRSVASFQENAKCEQVGQGPISQGGKDLKEKDLKISEQKTMSKDNNKCSRSKIIQHEGTSLQQRQRPRPHELNDKSNLIDLMKECHNELTSGEIVSLKILSQTRKTLNTPVIMRPRRYDELTNAEKLREACDIKATNIERESKLYDEFDMFTSVPGEKIHSYYLRLAISTTQDLIVLDDSTFNPYMSQDDQVIGDEDVSNEEFQTNKRKQTIVDEQPKEWDIENKIYCISMDNASANDKAIKNLRRIFEVDRKLLCDGRLFHVRCAAHILNLISQDGLETIKSVIKKVRDSVSFINASKHVKVEQICEILEVFNNVTHIISGSDYPTSNLFLYEVHKVKKVLDGKKDDENEFIRKMVNKMKEKFDKYWAEVHLLMAIAAVFDSLVKMWSLGFCFPKIYNPTDAKALIEMVEETLKSLHSEYVTIYNESTTQSTSPTQKSDLDVYFEDGCYMCTPEDNKSFNILDWWKNHESMYHILSKLARDILAIPITIVASEATFSAGTRLIDKYRAKLGVETKVDEVRMVMDVVDVYGEKTTTAAKKGKQKDGMMNIIDYQMHGRRKEIENSSTIWSNEATKKTQKTLLKQQYENFSASSTESLDSIFNRLQKISGMIRHDLKQCASLIATTTFMIVEQSVKKICWSKLWCSKLDLYDCLQALSSTMMVICYTLLMKFVLLGPNVNTASPQQDLDKIHEDDLEAMDLKFEALLLCSVFNLSIRWDTVPGSVELKEKGEEQVQTNMALMAFSDSEVNNDKTCSKTCLKNYETLKKQCDNLIVKLNQTEVTAATYKRGLATVEEQLITYRKNEVLFSEKVTVLKREVACKDYEINVLKSEFEKVKQEKEGIEFKIEKFDKASKDLDKLLGIQITDKSKKGLGYSAVPPPHPLIYNRPKKIDFVFSGLDDSKEPEFKLYGSENFVRRVYHETSIKRHMEPLLSLPLNVDKETIFPVDKKVESVNLKIKKTVKSQLGYAGDILSLTVGGNQWELDGQKFQSNRSDFVMYNKACFIGTSNAVNTGRPKAVKAARPNSAVVNAIRVNQENACKPTKYDIGFVDSGCSRHMTGNIAYLSDFKEFDGGYVTFGEGAHGGRISSKGTLKTNSLDFEDVYFVNELKFNLFSVSQMCDKKNYILFTDTACIVLSPNFKLPDESKILLKIPRKDNMYSFDMKNIVSKETLTCLVAKATPDESILWHRRLGHINFKNINKLVKDNLVRGLPTNVLKMTNTRGGLIENLVDKKVKIIRSDNGTEFKNKVMDDFCREKGIKMEYSVAMTPQQNGVAERRNRILIEAVRTMLVDSKLPTTFWANAFDGGYVAFGGGAYGGKITGKGTLKTDNLDFEDILNVFSYLQILCCLHENSTFLKIPRRDNMYSFDYEEHWLPKESLTCLVAILATLDESIAMDQMTWIILLLTNIKKLVMDNSSKDETSEILMNFIKEIENLVDKKMKIIRSNNGTEFKNKVMDDLCREKCIKREYSVAKTLQQNGVADRRNRTLIEAARTMLADSKLPTTFWAEAVSTACYVQNRVLFRQFDGKSDECFFVGYSLSSKAFRVYNTKTRRVEENLHIGFLENKPMIEGNGLKWLFDIDSLTQSMNYVPVAAGTIINESAGTQEELNAGTSEEISQDCIVMLIWKDASYFDSPTQDVDNGEPKSTADDQKQDGDGPDNENDEQYKSDDVSSPKEVNVVGQHVNTASPDVNTDSFKLNVVSPSVHTASSYDHDSPKDMFTIGASHTLEATHIEFFSDEDEPEVDLGNITNSYTVTTTPNTRIHKDHPIENVIGDVKSSVPTRRMTKPTSEQGFLSAVYEQKTHDTLNTCLYVCFLSQIEPTSIAKALSYSSWVEAMQEELLQFKLQQVWILMDLPIGKKAIGTKWVFKNKKDERGIVIRNKARLVAQGHKQE